MDNKIEHLDKQADLTAASAAHSSIDSSQQGRTITVGVTTGVLVAVIPAIFGYIFGYVDGLRKEELILRNSQIEKLYGPLYTLTQSSDATWAYFAATNWRTGSKNYFDDNDPPTVEQVDRWRLWIRTVFQPMNLQIQKIIVENTQLALGESMPKVFQDMVIHTEAYKAVIAGWSEKDRESKLSYTLEGSNVAKTFNFPKKIVDCVKDTYLTLRKRQSQLQRNVLYDFRYKNITLPRDCTVDNSR